MPFQVASASASFRAASEDRSVVHHLPGGLVVVVADGAGGVPGGCRAAELALAQVNGALVAPDFGPFTPSLWVEALRSADLTIERDGDAGETTAVIVALAETGVLVGASCGDSGALVVRADGTTDELTEHQYRKRRVGSGRAVPVGFQRTTLEGTLLLATDGLLGYARPEMVTEVLAATKDLDDAVLALVDRVRLPSGDLMDDVTVVLVRP
jgi:serine/threonine protein phosphatase PrpC